MNCTTGRMRHSPFSTKLGTLPTGTIPAEIVALDLMSVSPVQVGGSFFDVFVTLDNRPTACQGPPCPKMNLSTGTITITMHDDIAGGGTFDSFFDVFTKISVRNHATGAMVAQIFRMDMISSSGTPWSHTCAPGLLCLPEGTMFDLPTGDPPFTSGNFFITPAGINHTGPHPHVDPSQPIPEPSTVLLVASGLAGLGAVSWRPHRRK